MHTVKKINGVWYVYKNGKQFTLCKSQNEAEMVADMSNNSNDDHFSVSDNNSINQGVINMISASRRQ